MLYVNEYHPSIKRYDQPTLVFLHGLLGSGEDWKAVVTHLTEYHSLTVDLPCHGQSFKQKSVNFIQTCQLIRDAILAVVDKNKPIIFVGYSLGARLVMYGLANELFQELNHVGYFLEGGHFGLVKERERKLRLQNDKLWASRFRHESMEQVLGDWYQQEVFSSLTAEQREELIAKRAHNHGELIAEMLMSTSLAKQPYLLEKIIKSNTPVHYICGEKDNKFFELAKKSELAFTSIENAGHNVHKEQALKFAQVIRAQLILETRTRCS